MQQQTKVNPLDKSHIVVIKRVPFRGTRRGTGDDPEHYKWKIGGSINGINSLDEATKKAIMPDIIRVAYNSPEWYKALSSYYDNINVEVPIGGLDLEIGWHYGSKEAFQKGDKEAPGSRPLNPADYVLYQYCLGYSSVANTIDEINNSFNIRFYIDDKNAIIERKKARVKDNMKASKLKLDLVNDPTMCDNVLLMYGFTPELMTDDEKYIELEALAMPETEEKDADNVKIATFIKNCEDADLQMKAFVSRCLNNQILYRLPNSETVMYDDGGRETIRLGISTEDAVTYLRKAENHSMYVKIKTSLEFTYNQSGIKYAAPDLHTREAIKTEKTEVVTKTESVAPVVETTETKTEEKTEAVVETKVEEVVETKVEETKVEAKTETTVKQPVTAKVTR